MPSSTSVLTIAGVEVPAKVQGLSMPAPIVIGSEQRAQDGTLNRAVRRRKQPLRFSVGPVAPAEAAAWRGLVEGLGASWSFDDADWPLYADGTGTAAGGAGNTVEAGGRWGNRLKTTNFCVLPALYVDGAPSALWTILVWRYSGTAWEHFIFTSDGGRWKDGVATTDSHHWCTAYNGGVYMPSESNAWDGFDYPAPDASPVWGVTSPSAGGDGWPSGVVMPMYATDGNEYLYSTAGGVSGMPENYGYSSSTGHYLAAPARNVATPAFGSIFQAEPDTALWENTGRIRRTGATYGLYDDVVCWPFEVPEAWVPELYAEANARAWTPTPKLLVTGAFLGRELVMRGAAGDTSLTPVMVAGAYETAAQTVALELEEL